jgi:hypothetical protein
MTRVLLFLAFLGLIAGLLARLKIRSTIRRDIPRLDDDAIRRVVEEGVLHLEDEDEPLDLEEIEREEERFLERDWE